MDRGAWRATDHGITRVGHGLATKAPPPPCDLYPHRLSEQFTHDIC